MPYHPRRSKFNNQPTTVNGIRFASKAEARHGVLLDALERSGKISQLRRQVRYPITVNGILICTYVADFVYNDEQGQTIVVDVKGFRTDVYKIKAKLMLAVHGITITEVSSK